MNENISIIEDLIDLIPTSPFTVFLDNENQQKNSLTLSERLNFEKSADLLVADQIVLYTSNIKVYIEAAEENANFNTIYNILNTFYFNLSALEGSTYKGHFIFDVVKDGIFGYLGRDSEGSYCFSMNIQVKYYL